MLLSMTGFGRSTIKAPFGRLIAEILSVNRKYLEVFVSIPKELSRFEYDVRKWIGKAISRGQITVRIQLILDPKSIDEILPDAEFLRKLKGGWEKISEKIGIDPGQVDLPFLIQAFPANAHFSMMDEKDLPALRKCIEEALQSLLQTRQEEGKALARDLQQRLGELGKMADAIEKLCPDSGKKMRQRLAEKMKGILGSEGEERMMREVILFAEKIDISEELTRLHSHFGQFRSLLSPKGISVGRKMDFLVQEIGREINTIGSKSAETKISHLIVEMKSELEKMREQIQNVE